MDISKKGEPELENLHGDKQVLALKSWFGVRHVQSIILFFCLATNYLMRINLSVAMVVMTDKKGNNTETFDWTTRERGTLFSAFFWGYFFSNLAAAVLVTKFNNKTLLLCSGTYSAIATIATPLVVRIGGLYAFVFLRVSLGIMQGFMMPVTTAQMSRWVPPTERARCGSIVLGGMHFGTIVAFITSGALGESSGGWPSIFYLSGFLSSLWCVAWYIWGAERPSTCSYITEEEKSYIENSLVETSSAKVRPIPWSQIFTNKACYAVAIVTTTHSWGYWIFVTQMPTYFDSVLHYGTTNNGLISALPFACLWIVTFPVSYLADTLIQKKVTTINQSRKLFNTIGHWGAAVCLVALGYSSDATTAIVMYTLGFTLVGFTFMGFNINVLDIGPNFAGLIMGFTNGVANVSGTFGPLFVGYVVYDVTKPELWRIVFYVSAFIYFIGNLIFITMGSGETQKFNFFGDDEESPKEKSSQKIAET